ncbi:MAG: type 1 glutamine amidotransferase domain-containing protein [Eubacterium aggregans]|uniref:type 1 glutamine amidotransferase domain-containing protein n=1 Tax=Eubacterium aggregans TaxID=81409 RepID=UPI0023F3A3CE|nr:type 1 glutamine amidotransferase domain-containing protein [Eubacterium aggregans]MDD4692647.1 type 1 glutamine amidotransferase [Eubacterium aggregans]MEA5073602.1 type 1 glutamine amidotransferase domain-containing protein [Eubacterium aggregans]
MTKKIIALISEDFEDLELWYPVHRLREEGCVVDVVGEEAGHTYHGKYGVPCVSDYTFGDIDPADYDGILVPGGWAPDKLRRFPVVLDMVRAIYDAGKPVGEICHAGWVLISAGILEGKTVTSTPGIKDDMENAGATWVDEPSVVDGNIISARRPPDLPDYMKDYIKVLFA